MADSVASPLLQSLLDRLDSCFFSFGAGDEMLTRLRSVVAAVKDVAARAEQRFEVVEEIERWLKQVKRVAYELEFVLDDYEQQMRQVRNQKLMSCCFKIFTKNENRRRIEHVLRKLTTIASEGDWPSETNWRSGLYARTYSRTSFVGLEPETVGRDREKDEIIDILLSKSEHFYKVLPIVGVGGVGKTALARLVYHDERLTRNFRFKYWVALGNNLDTDLQRIGEAICSRKFLSTKDLADGVKEELMGKKFLFVLDNLCYAEMDLGIRLREWFGVCSPGSAIIVTTSHATVDSSGFLPPYFLQPLRDADCLAMFRKVALLPREETVVNQSIELAEVIKVLVANCRGLPLAVKILGALLPYNGEVDDWLSAASLALLELQKYSYTYGILPVLRLSYDLLPSDLKQCFAYCSIFPRGFGITKEKLMQLWNAEGFLRTSGSSESLDNVAEDCFAELLRRSFFDDIARDDSGNISCKMHDLVYDMALTVSSNTCSVVRIRGVNNYSPELRHCSLLSESEPSTPLRYLSKTEDLQTLLLLSGKFDGIPDTIFSRLSHLRVLDFSQSGICELPASVGSLKHMRYLDLSHTYIRKIPESICNLKYLQTLELSDCYNLEELPETVPQLTNLVDLGIRSCCSLTYLPRGIGKLRLLKKLPTFVLGKRSDCAKLNELSRLDLKEKLEIKNLENVTRVADAQNANLYEKVSLHSLALSWGLNSRTNSEMSARILEYLIPPPNLRDICLKGFRGFRFPSWMNQGLPSLLKISLINCSCQELPPLGQLHFLKVLHLKGMSEVRTIGDEFYGNGVVRGFPCLEQLEIYDMPNLEQWKSLEMENTEISTFVGGSSGPLPQEAFPCLGKLVIEGCPRLTALPVIPNLKSLGFCDSNEMLLSSIGHLPLLSVLVIEKLKALKPLTGYFTGSCFIEKLTLFDCDNLDYLFGGNQAFASLKCLSILHCDKLMSLPLGLRLLMSLQRLDIIDCEQLNDISILQSLGSLQELNIEGCRMLFSIPSSIHDLTNLQSLVIKGCPALGRQPEAAREIVALGGERDKANLQRTKNFSFLELLKATNNFSVENRIGVGSFGVVYRGKLLDSREVAIRRGETSAKVKKFKEKDTAFDSEILFLSQLNHKHLVGLVGFCRENDERLLVYEYMTNGALYNHLHGKDNVENSNSIINSWKMRIKIALDAARGIEYLHNYAVPPIIHRDIKSSNILLDTNWTARVSGIELSVGLESDEEFMSTWAAGTVGYIDPEYYSLCVLTTKSDVYSFGVVLLELLTGKKAVFKNKDVPMSVVDHAIPRIMAGDILAVVDRRVGVSEVYEVEAVELMAYTATQCVNLEGNDRPTMIDIVANLTRALALCESGPTGLSPGTISSPSD